MIEGQQSTLSASLRARLRLFFTNPIVGIIGSAASVISVPLAIFFYVYAFQNRELVYLASPARTTLARAGRPSALTVEYKGQAIRDVDVVAIQVALWNQGTISIRPEHVLEPIQITTDPPTPILEASISKRSREVTGFEIVPGDADSLRAGRVRLALKILEHNDGGVVQLIVATSSLCACQIRVAGIVEGQGQPKNLGIESSRLVRWLPTNRAITKRVFVFLLVIAGVLSGYLVISAILRRRRLEPRTPEWYAARERTNLSLLAAAVVGGFLIGILSVQWLDRSPPFGF